ncbi:SMI1/KNR4 family protein [Kitasatospora azatica]|uniref:SMI1/KNR4 family protein n=1 Tax=Kitasatospora azatica TaxID=58347 RepID=UPI0018DC01F5|nr:SMI1/KNR4 family protein [Kitasatospora azatica]
MRAQVLALGAAPFSEKVFGARQQGSGHAFQLEPPLSEAEVAAAEDELGVSLPATYRTFLLEVGAGGAGPYYGIFPLRHDGRGWHWIDDSGIRSDNALLGQAFPSATERARWAEELDAREPVEEDFPNDQSYLAAFRSWDAEWETLHAAMTAGAIRLNHHGCGYYTWLVVTGPERGSLWIDLRAADGPIKPLSAGPNRVDFRDWYLDWLTRATAEAHGGTAG